MKIILVCLIYLLSFSAIAHDKSEDIYFIGNSLTPKSLTVNEVRQILLGEKKYWNSGTPIKVFLLPSSNNLTSAVLTKYVGMLPSTYWKYITNRIDGNDFFMPTISTNEINLFMTVNCTPGAIGFISGGTMIFHDKADDEVHEITVTN